MHKFIRLILVVVVLLMLLPAVPVFAQGGDAPRPSVTISIDDIFWVVIGLAGILYGIIKSIRAGKTAAQTDAAAQERLAREQHNREMMDRYERIHAAASEQGKAAFDAVVGVVQGFAGWTKWKGDDAFVNWMRDIQTPGAPATLPPMPAPVPLPVPAPVPETPVPAPVEDTTNPKNR